MLELRGRVAVVEIEHRVVPECSPFARLVGWFSGSRGVGPPGLPVESMISGGVDPLVLADWLTWVAGSRREEPEGPTRSCDSELQFRLAVILHVFDFVVVIAVYRFDNMLTFSKQGTLCRT